MEKVYKIPSEAYKFIWQESALQLRGKYDEPQNKYKRDQTLQKKNAKIFSVCLE